MNLAMRTGRRRRRVNCTANKVLERPKVLLEFREYLFGTDSLARSHAGIEVGHESDRREAQLKFAGKCRFRLASHIYQAPTLCSVPQALCSGREPRPLNHDHRPTIEGAAKDCGPPEFGTIGVCKRDVDSSLEKVGLRPPGGAIHELIWHNDRTRTEVGREAASSTRGEYLAHP